MEDKCYWWDRDLRQCMHVNCSITNCDGGSMLCNLYQKDFSYIKTSTINEPSSADYIPMTYVETGIKDSGERTEFPSGAVRDMHAGKGDMVSIPWEAILRLSRHYENGAKKYKRWNYRAGINLSSYIDSACRHLAKYQCGCDDEDHLAAAAFNILGAMLVEEIQPELIDLPLREGKNRFRYFEENQNDK